jgi:hypothetical protein
MVDEQVVYGVSIAQAREAVDVYLLPPEEQEQVTAEKQAQENMAAAMSLGLKIVGLPEGLVL